jgi:hypothetical protein
VSSKKQRPIVGRDVTLTQTKKMRLPPMPIRAIVAVRTAVAWNGCWECGCVSRHFDNFSETM